MEELSSELSRLVERAVANALTASRAMIREECRRAIRESGKALAEDEVVDSKAAAGMAGVEVTTIRKWVRAGRLQPLGGQPYRFTVREVQRARDSVPRRGAPTEQVADQIVEVLLAERSKGRERRAEKKRLEAT
jgi:hypothetical protein